MEKSELGQILWEPSVWFTLCPASQVEVLSEAHKQQKITFILARIQPARAGKATPEIPGICAILYFI